MQEGLLTGDFWYALVLTMLFFMLTSIFGPSNTTPLSKMAGEEQGFVAGKNNAYSLSVWRRHFNRKL